MISPFKIIIELVDYGVLLPWLGHTYDEMLHGWGCPERYFAKLVIFGWFRCASVLSILSIATIVSDD